jgi:radical SAM protein with 4Fe4S-binding SPASM domain
MRDNLHDLPNMISLAEKLGVSRVLFSPLRLVGRAQEQALVAPEHTEYAKFYEYLTDLQIHHKTPIDINWGLDGFLLKPGDVFPDGFWCPVGTQLVVSPGGDVYPCPSMRGREFKIGNVFQDSLDDLLHSDRMAGICQLLASRREQIRECKMCLWKNLCQGGCMGHALDYYGTVMATDGFCSYRKRAYEQIFEKILQQAIARGL